MRTVGIKHPGIKTFNAGCSGCECFNAVGIGLCREHPYRSGPLVVDKDVKYRMINEDIDFKFAAYYRAIRESAPVDTVVYTIVIDNPHKRTEVGDNFA